MIGILSVVCLALIAGVCAEEPVNNEADRIAMLEHLVIQQAAQIEKLQSTMKDNVTSITQSVTQLQLADGNRTDQIQNLAAELSELIESTLFGDASRKRMLEYHDKCAFSNHGYCFFGYFDRDNLNVDGARLACEQRGAELANIYSEEQYNQAVDYLRQFLPGFVNPEYLDTRTGMTYEMETGIMYLSTGEVAPYVQWRPDMPLSTSGYEAIFLGVTTSQSTNNGMVNYPASMGCDAVLCQIAI